MASFKICKYDRKNVKRGEADSKNKFYFFTECSQLKEKYFVENKTEIKNTIRSLEDLSLATYIFHVIHMNYYCAQVNGIVIPCEIAIAEFSLMDGVRKTYHTLVDPGQIPLGYTYETELHSADTHQIPLPPNELESEADLSRILDDVKSFMLRMKGFMPPLYTLPEENIQIIRNVLCCLQKSASYDFDIKDDIFRVYPLVNLFYELRNSCARYRNEKGFPFVGCAEKELKKDDYSFSRGISCKFHEQTEVINHCSLSQVQRWSYIIAGLCCKDLEISLVPGQHIPKFADLSYWRKIGNATQLKEISAHPSLASGNTKCSVKNEGKLSRRSTKIDKTDKNLQYDYSLSYDNTSTPVNIANLSVTLATADNGDQDILLSSRPTMKNSKLVKSQETISYGTNSKDEKSKESSFMQNAVRSIKNGSSPSHYNSLEKKDSNEWCTISKKSLVNETSATTISQSSEQNNVPLAPFRLPKTRPEALQFL